MSDAITASRVARLDIESANDAISALDLHKPGGSPTAKTIGIAQAALREIAAAAFPLSIAIDWPEAVANDARAMIRTQILSELDRLASTLARAIVAGTVIGQFQTAKMVAEAAAAEMRHALAIAQAAAVAPGQSKN